MLDGVGVPIAFVSILPSAGRPGLFTEQCPLKLLNVPIQAKNTIELAELKSIH